LGESSFRRKPTAWPFFADARSGIALIDLPKQSMAALAGQVVHPEKWLRR
jgi:hypothetical protein